MARCRHERSSWMITCEGDGIAEWCYVCGAYRGLIRIGDAYHPRTRWVRPTGDRNNNPSDKLRSKVMLHKLEKTHG